jgi:hypothetical protein
VRVTHSDDSVQELERLRREFPLSPHWEAPEVFVEVTEIAGVRFYLNGLVASASAEKTATGARRALERPSPAAPTSNSSNAPACSMRSTRPAPPGAARRSRKKHWRLQSRRGVPDESDGSPWAYARSNGVAAGSDWAGACAAAEAEARERHVS